MNNKFIKYIGEVHPDPDTLLKDNFDQMISLAVGWAQNNFYTEKDMVEASKYGYDFHKTTSFPEKSFKNNCERNTLQWMSKFNKDNYLEDYENTLG